MKRTVDDSERQRVRDKWPLSAEPFQSLQPFKLPSRFSRMRDQLEAPSQALATKIYGDVSDTHFFSDSKNEAWRDKVWAMVNHMIDCEQKAWALDYFVFYRVVSKKYALYEFNTIMLALFSQTKPTVEALPPHTRGSNRTCSNFPSPVSFYVSRPYNLYTPGHGSAPKKTGMRGRAAIFRQFPGAPLRV